MKKLIIMFVLLTTGVSLKTGNDELATQLKSLLSDFEGFVSAERFQSLTDDNKLLSMNVWESEEAVSRWRNMIEHRMSQQEGKEKLFESYKITVAHTVREYTNTDRTEAPTDSNIAFDK